ncbi:MAG: hypothetical protein RBT38_02665 [Bacteroidales bacterium]|jgi:mono/diheme cytochrome c family protein|nr:hypothetical protein [Bacteroidales bacterium]
MKTRKLPLLLSFLFLLAGMALFSSCEKYVYQVETVDPEEPVLYGTQIQPIFTANCISCHKGSRSPDLRVGSSFEALTGGGYVNLPAADSRLYKMVVSGSHTAFTLDAEKQLILLWIEQGAQNN